MTTTAQTPACRPRRLRTALGELHVTRTGDGDGEPLIFLHGVFFDQTLWADCAPSPTGRPHLYLDLPAHGQSSDVGRDWRLDECADVLVDVLDQLGIARCIVIGHSWGAMTALRAAIRFPPRFAALGLFNMPFIPPRGIERLSFHLQKFLVRWPRFYARQVAKALYTPAVLAARPALSRAMEDRLAGRSPRELARVIDAVILGPADATPLIRALTVPALALIGTTDTVGAPPGISTLRVRGGHLSPQEAPQDVRAAIDRVIALAPPGP